ncbi:SDR family NAD(P)-dependent oxidoreductase [Burkholderia contaminans]|uniref:SDR family NAD(P)-dependent oxidoreductase n=1 Tax=Burkholderia contaminans TaxID=488447 RepID=A0A3N8PTV6_9BURK|nr:SDR family oxidoreductase [Burkholderia contaminans]RQT14948.1 SDR family NAD(P)-dependent oxidoreductase [Burkholderia contaminans]
MSNRLKDQVAIVAGAGATAGEGIGNGQAVAIAYAREGASVLLVDLNVEAAQKTRRMIEEVGGEAVVFQADVSRAFDCQAMVGRCLEAFGQVDILHNNVGIEPKVFGGILSVDEASWDLQINVNLKSMFLTCRAVLPEMLKRKKGAIVNISSISAERFNPNVFVYNISKAGVNALTRSLAIETADKGIRVNAIMPGLIDTPLVDRHKDAYGGDREKMRRAREERVPMKKMGESWDIANTSVFLASDEAKYITGQVLAVDGGYMCKI